MTRRGTSSANKRGNSSARRRRREWMTDTFGIPRRRDGKKTRIPCAHCGKPMRAAPRMVDGVARYSWEVDRFPICGHNGGRYVRGNIVPACPDCNKRRCTVVKKCRFGAVDAVGKARFGWAAAAEYAARAAA